MKIKSLTIEGMHKVQKQVISFDQLNYVYGPNGVGKSTILQAIQLALLGYIPGQSKASKEAIFRHANGRTIAVTLELDNDGALVTITRVWTQVGSTINAAVTVNPNTLEPAKLLGSLELPIFNFNEFIGMTANKLKDWFIDFLPKNDTKIDLWSEMKSAADKAGLQLSDRFVEFIPAYADTSAGISNMSEVTVEDIRKMNASLKTLATVKKSELARAEGAIQSLIHYDDFEETYSEDEYESKLSYAMNGLVAQKAYESQKATFENYMFQIAEIKSKLAILYAENEFYDSVDVDKQISDLRNKLNYYVDQYRQYETDKEHIDGQLGQIVAELHTHEAVIAGGDICPFTNKSCPSVTASVDASTLKVIELKAERDRLQTAHDKDIVDMRTIEVKQGEINRQISAKEAAYRTKDELSTHLNFLTQQTSTIAPPADSRSIEEWQQMVKELQDYKSKSEANRRYNDLIDTLTSNKFAVDTEIEAIKIWDKLTGVNGLQSSNEGNNPFDIFAAKLNVYIPTLFGDDCSANFNITAKANSFNFGINRGTTYIPFDLLSSGEKCMYTLALMTCIADNSDSLLKLILVDDMFDHLDDANITSLFEALSSIKDIQMIFAGVKNAQFGNAIDVASL